MKKLTRKLFLSIAALACCAATLVSTTFAWYVNNPQATVEKINGSTASAGTSGSISVSKSATSGFGKSISFENAISAQLFPVHATGTAESFTFKDDAKEDTTANVATLTFYVKADANGYATLKIGAVNKETTSTMVAQTAHTATGLSEVEQGESFYVDALQAMRLSLQITGTVDQAAYTTATPVNVITDAAAWLSVDEDGNIGGQNGTQAYQAVANTMTGGDANAYYAEVKGEAVPYNATTLIQAGDAPTLYLKANQVATVVVQIWLEGADADCFNACAEQDYEFTFQLDFVDAPAQQG